MKRILLTLHGRLASGLKDTLEFFLGQSEMIAAVDAYVDTSSDYLQRLQRFVDSAEVGRAIILADIYGGSVNQQVSAMVVRSGKDIPTVIGMNLPIALSVAMIDDSPTAERTESMLKECQLQFVKISSCETKEGDEDEFFARDKAASAISHERGNLSGSWSEHLFEELKVTGN